MKTLLLAIIFCFNFFLAQAQLSKADSLFEAKAYEKAYRAYDRVYEGGQSSIKLFRRMGYILSISENEEQRALSFFKKALRLDPNDAISNYYAGVLCKELLTISIKSATIGTVRNNGIREQLKEDAVKYLTLAAKFGDEDAKKELLELQSPFYN